MTANLFKALFSAGRRNPAPGSRSSSPAFPLPGMLPLLRDRGATVVQFTPKVTQVNTAAGSAYLSIFTQEKSPLETLFRGQVVRLGTSRSRCQGWHGLGCSPRMLPPVMESAPRGRSCPGKRWKESQ